MSIRVSNVRLDIDAPEAELPQHLARILGLRPEELHCWRILRKSLDARTRSALQFVYTAEVNLPEEEARITALAERGRSRQAVVELHEEPPFTMPSPGKVP